MNGLLVGSMVAVRQGALLVTFKPYNEAGGVATSLYQASIAKAQAGLSGVP